MNERQERTADVLGKLTVLGTIVLPLNIIGSLWGMNVKVPGQDVDNLDWFWSSMFTSLSLMCHEHELINENSYGWTVCLCHCFILHCEARVQYCIEGTILHPLAGFTMAMMTNRMDTLVVGLRVGTMIVIEIVLGQYRSDQVVDCILYGLYSLLLLLFYGYNLRVSCLGYLF